MIIYLKKCSSGLYPSDEVNDQKLASIANGEYKVTITKERNLYQHRRYMSLLNLLFSLWDVDDAQYKNFDMFRKNMAILSGYYEQAYDFNGIIRLEAKSISFAKMDEVEFMGLFSKTIDVALQHVLKNYTKDDLESVVMKVIGYG